jgi:Uma2 family endonuclease
MTALAEKRMTVDEFLAWAAEEPGRWELFDGVPVAMALERVTHGRSKSRLVHAFDNAIPEAKLPCEFLIDSAAVRTTSATCISPMAW